MFIGRAQRIERSELTACPDFFSGTAGSNNAKLAAVGRAQQT